jgi:hypothetical protein
MIFKTLAILFCLLFAHHTEAGDRVVLTTEANPQPNTLPTLGVWQEHNKKKDLYYTNVSASFPNIPDFTCDLWCYESPGIEYQAARELTGGVVELRHTWEQQDWVVVTTGVPLAGAVEVVATLSASADDPPEAPSQYPSLNICWQLRRASNFASEPDPYPEFVRRCFIFTERGRTFLHETVRRPIPVKSVTHKRNNPPWVQMYKPQAAPDDLRGGSTGWADYSPDRFTVPVIGAVSRDRKYLTALASGSRAMICQAWHDCMHNNARWLPTADGRSKEWRVKIYAMENDPAALLARFREDFPVIQPWE